MGADAEFVDGNLKPIGYTQFASVQTTDVLTLAPGQGRIAKIQVLTQSVRYRDDGPDPTPTTGMRIPAGGEILYNGDLAALKIVAEANGAEVNVLFYR